MTGTITQLTGVHMLFENQLVPLGGKSPFETRPSNEILLPLARFLEISDEPP